MGTHQNTKTTTFLAQSFGTTPNTKTFINKKIIPIQKGVNNVIKCNIILFIIVSER